MYRWPVRVVAGRADRQETGLLELQVPPRGAAFTLQALMHLGHPIHLALIDAYLRGDVRLPRGASLGHDSCAILANLVGPLVLLYTSGCERASLTDLLLLPPGSERPIDSRFLVWRPDGTATWLECASGRPGSGGRAAASAVPPWRRVATGIVSRSDLPRRSEDQIDSGPVIAVVEDRPEDPAGYGRDALAADPALVAALQVLASARVGRLISHFERGLEALHRAVEQIWEASSEEARTLLTALLADSWAEAVALGGDPDSVLVTPIGRSTRPAGQTRGRPGSGAIWSRRDEIPDVADDPEELADLLTGTLGWFGCPAARIVWEEIPIIATLTREAGGSSTVALLPDEQQRSESMLSRSEGATWATLEALIGTSISGRRTEAVELRLVGPDRTLTLSIGWSLVLPRNRRVHAAWLGSDGRAVVRLSPTGPED